MSQFVSSNFQLRSSVRSSGELEVSQVQTAAASNLGQMLNRICIKNNISLVNIVRKREQEDLLRGMGATFICNSSSSTPEEDRHRGCSGVAVAAFRRTVAKFSVWTQRIL
jgi:hypothetical protein